MTFFTIILGMKLQSVILAAGKGTRMNSEVPKPLIEVNGEPMLTTVIRTLAESLIAEPPVIVVGAWTNAIQAHYGSNYQYAIQTEINGTGGAVACALPFLDTSADAAPILILYADHPFITRASIIKLAETMLQSNKMIAMYTVTVPDFDGWRQPFLQFGRIIRNDTNLVTGIVEYKNASLDERAVHEVNPALYCVNAKWLSDTLPRIQSNKLTNEYYLTDLVELVVAEGHIIETIPLLPQEALGLNSVADIENAKNIS
jgi:bifunctional UDP-N-acetylglucosamine pyrophosphorylase / glucosamine-1-phosphate N-acetyltransferase